VTPFRPVPPVPWAATLLALAVSATAAAAVPYAQRDIRQLATSAAGTQFEVTVPEAQLTAMSVDPPAAGARGGAAVRIDIDGYAPSDTPGEAALPVRMVTVAVPPLGAVSVRGIGLDESVRDGVEVPMSPWVDVGRGSDVRPAPAAGECARLVEVGWMRHQRIARIELRPARWDAATKRLTTFGRIGVTVEAGQANAAAATPAAPDSDAFESVYRNLLVNYEQGRGWRSPSRAWNPGGTGPQRAASRAASLQIQAPDVPDSSLYVGRRWIKIGVRRTGFYRLAFSRLRLLAPFNGDTTIASDSLRLYTWAGYPILPEAVYCDSCGYSEVALGIVDDDGRMNHPGDAIYFYAVGPSDWADHFDPNLPDTVFVTHPYEARNFYYLGFSTALEPLPGPRRRISTRDGTPTGGGAVTPATFPARVHQEVDDKYDPNLFPGNSSYFWDKFVWTIAKEGESFTAGTDAPQADTAQGARVRARLFSRFTGGSCSDFRSFVDATWNSAPAGPGSFVWGGFLPYTIDTPVNSLHTRSNSLSIQITDLPCRNEIAVSWFDLFYQRKYVPTFERLEFQPPAGGGLLLYRIAPFQSPTRPRLFDISDPLAPIEVTGATYTAATGGGQELSFESSDASSRRYVAIPDSSFADVQTTDLTGASGASLDNLRSHTQQADYVVIYYDEFQAAADTLATWRRGHNGFRTKTVPVSAIYDQFSGGRTDPTAIRNFLRAAYYNWSTQPSYVTFLGDASYDFKNLKGKALLGQPGCPLPTFENNFEGSSVRQYTTDDWLLNVDDPQVIVPEFLTGRLPVPDAASAMDVVRNKVLAYERSAPMGLYRDRVMLIADDNEQAAQPDGLDWRHLEQTTALDTVSTPANFDRVYVYLHTYEDGASNTKPGARIDILDNINGEGVTAVNFIGHGSPFQLADEKVMIADDPSLLNNGTRLPLFIAASCDVGRFSDPTRSSLGEHLLLRTGGGAIGVISATDLAYSGQNALLNGVIYQSLFARASQGGFSGEIAKALLVGKLDAAQHASGANAQKYQLIGDAVSRLNLPELWVELKLKDDGGLDTTAIQQGRKFSFTGRVLDRPNGTLLPVDGVVDVRIDDAAPILRAPRCTLSNCDPTPFYLYKAGSIYRGSTEAHGGTFSGQFMVPIEARPGSKGKIRAYLSGTAAGSPVPVDAAGSQKLRVATGSAPPGDQRGPEIRLSFPGGATRVRNDATLRIDLSDSSGILITGHTPQNGIVVTVDGNTTSREEVTESFRYNPGSFQAGTASFPLPRLPRTPLADGFHILTVSAADNLAAGLASAQHRSQATLEFEVVRVPPLRVSSAYLFPDPTGSKGSYGGYSGGEFVVDTEGGPIDLQLRIFSVSGRVLRLLKVSGEGKVQIPWDGLDAEGQGLANGVYLFKVVAHSSGSGTSAESGQTADAQGKFVVLNP
jgi:hypothetical protein